MKSSRVNVPIIRAARSRGEKITMLTAYDYLTAMILDEAEVDILLVGDSLGMVFQGNDTTLPVTLDEIIYHTKVVRRGVKRAMVVADMPFLSYHISVEEALRNAGRVLKETGAQAVKLEGGRAVAEVIEALAASGIPVMGHVGLGPQSSNAVGGYKVQGKNPTDIRRLVADIEAVERAGAFSVVIEAVPWPVAKRLTERVEIPTIGIGAGPYCTGQVLVTADLLGLFTAFQPHFVRRFANLAEESKRAVQEYVQAVEDVTFPSLDESYSIDESILRAFDELPDDDADSLNDRAGGRERGGSSSRDWE